MAVQERRLEQQLIVYVSLAPRRLIEVDIGGIQ